MINMSQVQYPNDRVDITGTEHPTVGENIRNGSKKITFNSQGERNDAINSLGISQASLKNFILNMLTGSEGVWGGAGSLGFSEDDKQKIKNWLDS